MRHYGLKIVLQKARFTLGFFALCPLLMAANPAAAQSVRDIENRIDRLENELQTLSRAMFKGETPPPGALTSSDANSTDAIVRLQQMETSLRELTGKLEEQSYAIEQLKAQVERLSGDVDTRFNTLQGQGAVPGSMPGGMTGNIPPAYTSPAAGMSSSNSGDLTSADTVPAPDAESGDFKWSSRNTPVSADTAAPASGGHTLGTMGSSGQGNDTGAEVYENAFSLLKNGKYDAAEQGFLDFMARYPGHSLESNAKYWLGETYYARGDFDKASRSFAETYQKYPKGSKAPDSLLKLGMSLGAQGKKQDACVALGQVSKAFGAGAGPVLRRAEQEMTRLGC